MKRRKPDLLVVLAVLVGMGVLATSLAQGMMGEPRTGIATLEQQR